ncbi:MAG TPA: aldehyde dehydrogenase [Firmicutes bacterium]|nr:aldehyde dehydrogenase [Bacillota bacterium]
MNRSDLQNLVEAQRAFFRTGKTLSPAFRRRQLCRLKAALSEREPELLLALKADLNKSAFEAYTTELGIVREELNTAIRQVEKWSAPHRVPLSVVHFPATGWVQPEPYGVALIMSPWNYPLQLTLNPLIAAIAAGNCAVVKPSAYAPHTAQMLALLLRGIFPEKYVAVVEGGREENAALLELEFDTIFFTGSVAVGRIVMEAAARHLTPVTLELGGKSPAIVDKSANLRLAARRILWGKTVNSGQTCVAPDYVLVDRAVRDKLLQAMRVELKRMWGVSPLSNPDYPCIVNDKHFRRLLGLLKEEHACIGGGYDSGTRRIEPTVLDSAGFDSPVMQEEIFGPILPVIPYDSLDEAIAAVVRRPKPLALYLFTSDRTVERRVLQEISFGGGCVNDTLMHLVSDRLPFGGVGASGMGQYHGKYGFDTFSHQKGIVKKSTAVDIPLRYPPYRGKLWLAKRLMK